MISGLFIFMMIVAGCTATVVFIFNMLFSRKPQKVVAGKVGKPIMYKPGLKQPKHVNDLLRKRKGPMAVRKRRALPAPFYRRLLEHKPVISARD